MKAKTSFSQEYHEVKTQDGYILTLSRVSYCDGNRGTLNDDFENFYRPKPIVLLVHGLVCSADEWFVPVADRALPNKLAKLGFDVWLANLRGTKLSQKHSYLSTESNKYWDFSWYEMALYDLPAMIDYILDVTNAPNLYYIGHSLGCAVFLISMILNPEYKSKIRLSTFLAPAAYGTKVSNLIVIVVLLVSNIISPFKAIYSRPLFSYSIAGFLKIIIFSSIIVNKLSELILKAVFVPFGAFGNNGQLEKSRIPILASSFPATTSAKVLLHGAQCYFSGVIKNFDYGYTENLLRYGQPTPYVYDLTTVSVPIAIFYSDADQLCPAKDIEMLANQLPKVIVKHQIKNANFSHMDFLVGKDAHSLIYEPLCTLLKTY